VRVSRASGGAVIVIALLTGCARTAAPAEAPPESAPVGHAELDVAGMWSGGLDERGYGVLRMTVSPSADTATAFDADVTFQGREGEHTAKARGELTPHGHLVVELDADASLEAHITDPVTLDYCFAVYGAAPVYSCGRLVHD
jgi:hypothetical protein